MNLHRAWTALRLRGRNDVLCRDVIDQQQHPGSKRFERRHGLDEAGSGSRKFLHFIPVNTFDQLIPRREMAKQGTCSDARLLGEFVQTDSMAAADRAVADLKVSSVAPFCCEELSSLRCEPSHNVRFLS